MNDAQEAITMWLTMLRDCCYGNGVPKDYTYAGIGDFLLHHGVWYEPASLPAHVDWGIPTLCFRNAAMVAAEQDYSYVEGYAIRGGIPGLPIHHAWNIDDEGRVIDNTWRIREDVGSGIAYFGVPFSLNRVIEALSVRHNTVLDNPRSKFKIFRDPWRGETC